MIHYTIHSPITGRTFKVSYKAGKFFRLEKSKGPALSAADMQHLGLAIPALESEVPKYQEVFPKLVYAKIEKDKTIYQQYVAEWFNFYTKFMDMQPRFGAVDGRHLTQIKNHLTKVGGTEVDGLLLFNQMLTNWDKLDAFHKANTDLKYINSRLNVILNAIKKAGKAETGGSNNDVRL